MAKYGHEIANRVTRTQTVLDPNSGLEDSGDMPWPLSNLQSQSTNSQSTATKLAFGGGSLLLFLVFSFLIGLPVHNSLQQQACQSLQATLRGDVIYLESWVESRKSDVREFTAKHFASFRETPDLLAETSKPIIPGDLAPRYVAVDPEHLALRLADLFDLITTKPNQIAHLANG